MRNLTQEAVKLAEARIIADFPVLANKQDRINLSDFDKHFILSNLITYGELYEQDLIGKLGQ